jgi:CorA-like Mg2+ transporter protein
LQWSSRTPKSLAVLPTIQYRSRIALKREPTTNNHASPDHPTAEQNPLSLPQNAACLASDYGRSLRPEIMECDAFYALDELFRFAIASESQFLEMMKHKIKAATITGGGGRIEDLDAALDLIEDHRQYISENLETVRAGGHPNWPKAPEKLRKRASAARERLEGDYEYLLNYAERLAEKCIEGITIMMNDAMLRQSQRAIEQTNATMKLTLLAFIFAPLSFTTSFFGMQVREIENKGISLWVWFLFTFVLLVMSFCFWKWRVLALLGQFWTTLGAHLLRFV